MFNRRAFIATSTAAATITTVPAPSLAREPLIRWEPGAKESPHAHMVEGWCIEQAKKGMLYATNAFLGYTVKLTDPHFRILTGKPVWNFMTGYTDEPGLIISIVEKDIHLTNTSLATSKGHREYFKHNTYKYPDYFVRMPVLEYEDMVLIEDRLPKGHVGLDMGWLVNA